MRKGELLTAAAVGSLAGMSAGVIAGLGARVAMRMVADGVADNGVRVPTEFTIEGSIALLVIGAIVGAPAGLVYVWLARRIPGPTELRAFVFGLLTLAVIGPLFFRGQEFFSPGRVLLFAALFPIYGLVLGLAMAPSGRVVRALPMAARGSLALVAIVAGGLVGVGIVSLALQSTGGLPM